MPVLISHVFITEIMLSLCHITGDECDIVLPINEIKDPKFAQADHKWVIENLRFLTDKHRVNEEN